MFLIIGMKGVVLWEHDQCYALMRERYPSPSDLPGGGGGKPCAGDRVVLNWHSQSPNATPSFHETPRVLTMCPRMCVMK